MTQSILVTGGQGQVGTALRNLGRIAGLPIIAPPRAQLDILDTASIGAAIGPGIAAVVNCAAFTDVDGAESQPGEADRLNAQAPRQLAQACNRHGIPLVHLSTDYVFDGRAMHPYRESDPVAPAGAYGRSKAEGERLIAEAGGPHVIFRTAWVISPWRKNFVRTMIRLAGERDEIRVVDDQRGSPTSAIDLAQAIAAAMPAILERRWAGPQVCHAVNTGFATWFELAEQVMARLAEAGRKTPSLLPIATRDYPTPATRPANSMLATDRLREMFGIEMRPWREAVDDVVKQCLARPS